MTVMASKRFYVGNLFPDVQESDLEKLFKTFGPVNNVEIKKKSDIDGKLLTTFAFVQVQIADESDVSKCIQKFNNLKWKKHLIKVQQAQESFLTRLQREREEVFKPATEPSTASENVPKYDPISFLQTGTRVNNTKKRFDQDADREEKEGSFTQKQDFSRSNHKDLKFATVSFLDKQEEEDQFRSNNLEFKKSAKVYHSSSEEEEDDVPTKSKRSKYDVLAKLESFNSGFWKDEDDDRGLKKSEKVTLEGPFGQVTSQKDENQPTTSVATTAENMFRDTSAPFSLLKTFAPVEDDIQNDDEEESKLDPSEPPSLDNFALRLKEKAVTESSSGIKEHFFFVEDDDRFRECQLFLKPKETLEQLRTNYEEKRPVLASIMKRKMKNRAKKQEKLSFGSGGKKQRKFNPNFKKNKLKR